MPHVEEMNPFRQPLTLGDWYFVYCLPVSQHEFVVSQANGGFALPFVSGYKDWHAYSADLARTKTMLDAFAVHGLHVVLGAPRWVFLSTLRRRRAVILLTHATPKNGGGLEFCGKMETFTSVAGGVSPRFFGILEICACECKDIQPLIKQRAPGCISAVEDKKLHLGAWLFYYETFLRVFHTAPTTYYDAKMRARELIRAASRNPS
ncbi:MAG: hypothetical protein ACLQBA_01755 [Candidatus Binataceae bacterium]